jgi:UDPglucose 6-dehydrogenase
MTIAVIGTGYVGLVTGTCFAEMGNDVICVDIDTIKLEKLKNGQISMYEPGLQPIFERNVAQGRLSFTYDLSAVTNKTSVIFLALPTPQGADGAADLSAILTVTHQLSDLIQEYTIIINKSTVPVGTAKSMVEILSKKLDRSLFDVVSNPEFLREGSAVPDFMKPERVIIGSQSDKAIALIKSLYEPFVRQGNPIYIMDEVSAELSKYAANSFLATKISFMNEIANLSDQVGANVDHIRKAIGSDSRIGKRFLFPGVGFGGSCFPKDVHALKNTALKNDYQFKILDAVIDVNENQRILAIKKLKQHLENLEGKKVAIWGLSFKPNTDDIREAPAIYTIDKLLKEGCEIAVFDPEAVESTKMKYGDKLLYATNQYDALRSADALLILTEWSVFRTPNYNKMKSEMRSPLIIDGRNVFSPSVMKQHGFVYESIGRPSH